MRVFGFYILTALVGILAFAGCAVGPEYERPAVPFDANDGFFNAAGAGGVVDFNEIDNWWKSFGDETTTVIVEKMLENNYDLKAAAARVSEAKANLDKAAGQQLPQVSYGFSRARSKSVNAVGDPISTSYSQDITVSYVLDIFGKLKHNRDAAMADLFSSEANQRALINSLIATAVKARVNVAVLQRRLDIARANTESLARTLQIVERRYEKGLVSPVDVRLARENLANAQTAEPQIERSLATAEHGLDVLLGKRPGGSDVLPRTLAVLPDLEAVPVGIPAYLLDRRPDIVAAEMQIRAANERVGVSVAELYPDLNLSASYGTSAGTWRSVWNDESEIYSAVFRMTQPIFKGGQLKAEIRAAKARHEQAVANYSTVLLTALQEVEDALVNEKLLLEQLGYAKTRLEEARQAEELSRDRYQRGVDKLLTVLESERRRQQAETELELLRQLIWNNRVNLLLALGGDWTQEDMVTNNESARQIYQKGNS